MFGLSPLKKKWKKRRKKSIKNWERCTASLRGGSITKRQRRNHPRDDYCARGWLFSSVDGKEEGTFKLSSFSKASFSLFSFASRLFLAASSASCAAQPSMLSMPLPTSFPMFPNPIIRNLFISIDFLNPNFKCFNQLNY